MPRTRIYKSDADKQAAYRKRKKSARLTVHFQSILDVRETPADLFAVLDREFSFDLDVCALPHNAKCPRYFTPATDGLSQEWQGACFMNPPSVIPVQFAHRFRGKPFTLPCVVQAM